MVKRKDVYLKSPYKLTFRISWYKDDAIYLIPTIMIFNDYASFTVNFIWLKFLGSIEITNYCADIPF